MDSTAGDGFVILSTNKQVLLVGSYQILVESSLEGEIIVMDFALSVVVKWKLEIGYVFTECVELQEVVKENESDN